MKIILDSREAKLIELLTSTETPHPPIETAALDVGDVHIYNDLMELCVVIERKSVSDLVSSFKDNRYVEQSLRLKALPLDNKSIYYIIEGRLPPDTGVCSAIFSLSYYKGFSVLRTMTVNETAHMILCMANKLARESARTRSGDKDGDYLSHIKLSKKANVTADQFNVIALAQVPNVSIAVAQVVMGVFKTLTGLKAAIESDGAALDNVKLASGRRIGKNVINNIKSYIEHI